MNKEMSLDIKRPRALLQTLRLPRKLLMGPGPSNCSRKVLQAASQPVVGHMHEECFQIMNEIKWGIQYIFQTNNTLTLALSASGHAAMEASLCNLIEPGETALISIQGIWGHRASDMARRHGAIVKNIEVTQGKILTNDHVEDALAMYRPVLFFIVHGESSTGVCQPLEGLGNLCHRYNCLLVVDAVASLGAVPIFMDRLGIDVLYTGSQKVLGAPPGLSPISFSPRAHGKLIARTTPVQVYYLDMKLLGNYWGCDNSPRRYHHTVSSTLLCCLREALSQLVQDGLEKSWDRHSQCANWLWDNLEHKLGLQFLVSDRRFRLPTVTAIMIPKDLDWTVIRDYAMKRYQVEISGGLGPTSEKVLRIGLMGNNATLQKVNLILRVLNEGIEHAKMQKVSSKL